MPLHIIDRSQQLLEQSLLGIAVVGSIAMLSLPAARSIGETFGWMPFWLLALPLSAWLALRLSRLRRMRDVAAEVIAYNTVHRFERRTLRAPAQRHVQAKYRQIPRAA